jgi:predicted dehydrogenase
VTLKVGIAGLGAIGRAHLAAWSGLEGTAVTGVCDCLHERLNDLPRGAETFTELDDLFASSPDVVDICLPTDLHRPAAEAAMEAGAHVFCEKPLAVDPDDAEAMLRKAERTGRVLMVGHFLRFRPEYRLLGELVGNRSLGRLMRLSLQRLAVWPTDSAGDWVSRNHRSGLAAIDLHIHDVDVVLWWLGMPRAVTSSGVQEDDGGVSYIQTRYDFGTDGPEVTAEGGWVHDADPLHVGAVLEFEHAIAEYHSTEPTPLTIRHTDGRVERPHLPQRCRYTEALRHFVQCVQNGQSPCCATGEDALTALRVARAEVESVRRGRTVAV